MATDVWTHNLITCYTYPAHYEAVSDNMFHEGYYKQWTGSQVHRTQDPGPRTKRPKTQDLGPSNPRPQGPNDLGLRWDADNTQTAQAVADANL